MKDNLQYNIASCFKNNRHPEYHLLVAHLSKINWTYLLGDILRMFWWSKVSRTCLKSVQVKPYICGLYSFSLNIYMIKNYDFLFNVYTYLFSQQQIAKEFWNIHITPRIKRQVKKLKKLISAWRKFTAHNG